MNRIEQYDRAMQGQLDRLAGGDLPESERSNLLAWLDEDVTRWRACGLAFLEAQMWSAAAAIAPREAAPPATFQPAIATSKPAKARRDVPRHSTLALTLLALVAFISGAVLSRWLPPVNQHSATAVVEEHTQPMLESDKTLIATVPVKTNSDAPLMLQVPVSTDGGAAAKTARSSFTEYDRRQWEKRGFEVVEELRYLPARLPDGRQVMVPVNKVHLKFKGTPVS
jgi:hypothetical protein